MKKIIWVLLAMAVIMAACVKYEEGPAISTLSVKKRIYGDHILKEYYVDGADSFDQYYDSLGLVFSFIHDDVSGDDVCVMDGPRRDGFSGDLYWGWELSSDKRYINIVGTSGTATGVGPFGINKLPIWEILRLDKEQMKLKTTYNNKEYQVVLDK